MTSGVTRIAPTPSGFLHTGNLVNFVLTQSVAQELDLALVLRIDDADAGRLRNEYVNDIFRVLEFLNITDFTGPHSTTQQLAFSQLLRHDRYRDALSQMGSAGAPLFVCTCSRTQLREGRCINNCTRPLSSFDSASDTDRVRLHFTDSDVTLWGRDHPSYHLVSCVDDADLGVTHVVRGDDLAPSSEIHAYLNTFLDHSVKYAHHPLLLDDSGQKLSKSQGTNQLELTDDLSQFVNKTAEQLLPGVLTTFTISG